MIDINNYTNCSSQFYVESRNEVTIPVSSTGTVFNLPFVSGVVYKLTSLSTTTTSVQGSINWVVDGNNTITNVGNSNAQSSVITSMYGRDSIFTGNTAVLTELYCQEFSLQLTSGSVTTPIFIVYEIGVIK